MFPVSGRNRKHIVLVEVHLRRICLRSVLIDRQLLQKVNTAKMHPTYASIPKGF
uniref:HMG box domain-containing protein n=1 Tax=Parascaris univalens TaxID=6257 RepID=A0A914ZQ81_PARUN